MGVITIKKDIKTNDDDTFNFSHPFHLDTSYECPHFNGPTFWGYCCLW